MISHALGGTLLYENDVCVGPPLRMRIMPLSRAKNRVANHNGFFWGSYDQSAFYILKNVNLEVSKHVLLLTVAHSAIIYLNYFRTHFLTQRFRYLAICRVSPPLSPERVVASKSHAPFLVEQSGRRSRPLTRFTNRAKSGTSFCVCFGYLSLYLPLSYFTLLQ